MHETPHNLNYGGNCVAAFRFYERHRGGKITLLMTHGEAPDQSNVPPGWKHAVLPARMSIGETELLANDVPPEHFQPMRSAYLSLGVDSSADAERLHALLAEGGQVFISLAETFFAHRFSMLRDRFGTLWMLIHAKPMAQA